jgi:hypothetical protein
MKSIHAKANQKSKKTLYEDDQDIPIRIKMWGETHEITAYCCPLWFHGVINAPNIRVVNLSKVAMNESGIGPFVKLCINKAAVIYYSEPTNQKNES